jgi:hypothetical protein
VVIRLAQTLGSVANFALHPYDDADANKRLELWLEMDKGVELPADCDAATSDLLRELAVVNQDFRESLKMIGPALRPAVIFHRFGESPMSGQDIRIKRRYIL